MVASGLAVLENAIDRPANQALSTETDYTSLIKVRSTDWTASFYINHTWVGDLLENYMGSNASPAMPLINPYAAINWTGMLLSISAIKQGARVDMYVDFDESQSSTNTAQLQDLYTNPLQVIDLLPQDTVAFVANKRFDLLTQSLLSASYPSESERKDFLESLNQSLGFSLQDDLLDQLTGEWALFIVPSTHGFLPSQAYLNMAASLLVQTDGDLDLKPIREGLERTGVLNGINIDEQERNGMTYYQLSTLGVGDPIIGFCTGNGYFTLGTDPEKLRLTPRAADTIANSINYQTSSGSLPGQMRPSLYVDFENLFADLREGMAASEREDFDDGVSALAPIQAIVSGSRLLKDSVAHTSIVIILAGKCAFKFVSKKKIKRG
jgi:hypothetical protein